MKKKLLIILFSVFGCLTANAQTLTVTGQVIGDNTNTPLPGVSVLVTETKQGVSTNADGKFSITITGRSSVKLAFSYIGYNSQTVTTSGAKPLVVQLSKNQRDLDQVVVVGYASVQRRDVTGSISSVGARQIKDVPLSSAAQILQGRLAGVQVVSSEGAPGAEVVIRVRGGGSITQDNSPLYIVDGVQVENALSVIAPQDIASVDVLKDASSTSIYGARGANGVVIITTKSGRPGKTQVSYTGSAGWGELSKTMSVLSPYDFVLWQYERSRSSSADSSDFARTYGTTWDTLQNYKNIDPINWQNEVFGRKALFQNHNLSMNGGTAATNFNLSLTANKEDGILLESGFDRKIANFKLDHKVSDYVKTGINVRYLDQAILGAGTTNSGTRATNRLRHTINYRPFELPVSGGGVDDFDEAYYLASGGATNPVLLTQAEYRNQKTKATYLTGYVSINLLKNLTFRSTFGYDYTTIRQSLFYSKITNTARQSASLPIASIGDQRNSTFNNSNTLQYTLNKYKGHHDFSVLAGEETVEFKSASNNVETRYFPADISAEKALANMGLGSAPSGSAQPLPSSTENAPSRIFSLFGRLSYAYNDKYLVTINLRADRTSKFSSDNGTLVFPSGSVAWRFSAENFMHNMKWLTDGKLRIGYGSVGNNRIGNLLYRQLYGVTGQYAFNHSILPGFAPSALANPELRWEKNVTRNIGLDLAFFNNKIQLTIDAYKNTANDLLLAVQIPPTTGYTSQIQNIGATSNRGLEIQLNATPIQKRDFSWNSNFNIAFNRNRVENLGGPSQMTRSSGWQGSDGVDDYLVKVGQPVGLMYGFVTDGFYSINDFNYDAATATYTIKPGIAVNGVYGTPQPGMLKWKDLNGDGNITADGDRRVIGNANPKFTGGWNNQFTYKNFDASIFVNFVVGNDIYNANKIEWTDGAYSNLNMLNTMKGRWTNVNNQGQVVTDPKELATLNEKASIWSPVKVQRWWLHSWAIEDGSYLRFNNVTLGYTLPKHITERAKIASFRVFATVNNLGVITNYSGFDPDVTARRTDPLTPGVDFAAYPRSKTWVFGVNVIF
ncbi:TonB-dependent receptor [Chitinophaga sp. CF118]|uniref:SusC/RagA family TonB-linked outer membrane protein n=1 Tax=Chitinophaga sp. CF118 TaxID=1884367 RepID=UPI000B7F5B31|nr:TonB-dependent receptor [Chitinophaga sp. CF118]